MLLLILCSYSWQQAVLKFCVLFLTLMLALWKSIISRFLHISVAFISLLIIVPCHTTHTKHCLYAYIFPAWDYRHTRGCVGANVNRRGRVVDRHAAITRRTVLKCRFGDWVIRTTMRFLQTTCLRLYICIICEKGGWSIVYVTQNAVPNLCLSISIVYV